MIAVKQRYTPGPWRVVGIRPGHSVDVETSDSEPISVGGPDDARNCANAQLIANATELLAAAQLVLSRWESGDLAEAVRALDAAVWDATAERP